LDLSSPNLLLVPENVFENSPDFSRALQSSLETDPPCGAFTGFVDIVPGHTTVAAKLRKANMVRCIALIKNPIVMLTQ
jgi:hypothetical protein